MENNKRGAICYIFGAGKIENINFKPKKGDYIIAADGGYAYLKALNINPDMIVGDFDSLTKIPNHENIIALPMEKDDTDMMFAIKKALKLGVKTFILYGGTGGRFDHTMANIQSLAYLSKKGAVGYLVGNDMVITAVTNGKLDFDSSKKGIISVFCIGDKAEGVSLKGLKYPLTNHTLTFDMPLGVSNEFTGQESTVSVEEGTLVVMWYEKGFRLV